MSKKLGKMLKGEIRLAISGFGGSDVSEPGTAVARCIKAGWKGSVSIDAFGYDIWMTGAFSNGLIGNVHIIPPLADGDEIILERILEIHKRRQYDAILPCLDLEIPTYARLESRLRDKGIKVLLPDVYRLNAISKLNLSSYCYENKIPSPITVHVPNIINVPYNADTFRYPVMIKGTIADAKSVENKSDAFYFARKFNNKWGGGAIIQEKIEGEEYDVSIVARSDGSCASILPMRKLGVNKKGKGMVGTPINDPELIKQSLYILRKLNWKGPLELEFIKSHNTKKYILLEINPRFPSWVMLSHFAGVNQPVVLLKEILKPGVSLRNVVNMKKAFVRNVEENVVKFEKIKELTSLKTLYLDKLKNIKQKQYLKKKFSKGAINVALTGISSFDDVGSGLGVAKAIRKSNEVNKVYGLGYGPYDTGIYRKDLFNKIYLLQDQSSKKVLLQRILEIHKINKINVIIPGLDGELEMFIDIEEELKKSGINVLLPSSKALKKAKNIIGIYNHSGEKRDGFSILKTLRSESLESFRQVSRWLGFPFVAKGVRSGFAADPVTVFNKHQLPYIWQRFQRKGYEVVVSKKFVFGEEFDIAGVCDINHDLVSFITIKKLLKCDKGKAWAARRVFLPKLEDGFRNILKEIKWTGPIEFEFIRDVYDEDFKLIEINPRFPAWISYTENVGKNLPLVTLDLAMSKRLNIPEQNQDLVFIRNCLEIDTDMIKFGKILNTGFLDNEKRTI